MIADLSRAAEERGSAMAALALVVAIVDLLNSSGRLSDDEVSDICRNAQALLPDAGAGADGAREIFSGVSLSRTLGAQHR
jgi:hypothetical protein